MKTLKAIFGHRFLGRYGWFYVALIVTAAAFFWAGVQYANISRSSSQSLATLLETGLPGWINQVERHSRKKSLGNPDARVKIVEYMDLECPYCLRYSSRVFPRILDKYVKTGKVYYVIKHYPLPKRIHPHALSGAIAAECAANQGKFWEFKSLAMANRRFQSESTFLAIARTINMPDQDDFNRCLTKREELNQVIKERKQGTKRGVQGTPTVFINDTAIRGVQSFSRYQEAIEKELSNSPS